MRCFLELVLSLMLVQQVLNQVNSVANQCGKPVQGACSENRTYMCRCKSDGLYPTCNKYPPAVYSASATPNISFVNGSKFELSVTVRWQANKLNNEFGLDDMWGFDVLLVALDSVLADEFCCRFDSQLYRRHLINKNSEFNGYYFTFTESLHFGTDYQALIQPLPAKNGEDTVTKRKVSFPDICEFADYPVNLPLRCCQVKNLMLTRTSQDNVLVSWSVEEKCRKVKSFLIEAESTSVRDCVPEPIIIPNKKGGTHFVKSISIRNFIKMELCAPYNLTVKCKMSSEECYKRSTPVPLDLLNDCVVSSISLKNGRDAISWKMNKDQCSVVLDKFEIKTVSLSSDEECQQTIPVFIKNVSVTDMSLSRDLYKPECSYEIYVTCIYQNDTKCKQSQSLHIEGKTDKMTFKVVVGVLGAVLGALLVLILFIVWKCKKQEPESLSIMTDTDIWKVGISHDSGNCDPCREAVLNLVRVLHSTGRFSCTLDITQPRATITRSEFNEDLIHSSDRVIVIHSHNSTGNVPSNCQELQDFADQQSHIIQALRSPNSSHKFANVYFDKFTDHCPNLGDLSRCRTFSLPSMLENLVSHMLGEDEQVVSVRDFDRRDVRILNKHIQKNKHHYRERERSRPVRERPPRPVPV